MLSTAIHIANTLLPGKKPEAQDDVDFLREQHERFNSFNISSAAIKAAVQSRGVHAKTNEANKTIQTLQGEINLLEGETNQVEGQKSRNDHLAELRMYAALERTKGAVPERASENLEHADGSALSGSKADKLNVQLEQKHKRVLGEVFAARQENFDDRIELNAEGSRLSQIVDSLTLAGKRVPHILQKKLAEIQKQLAEARRDEAKLTNLQNTTVRLAQKSGPSADEVELYVVNPGYGFGKDDQNELPTAA